MNACQKKNTGGARNMYPIGFPNEEKKQGKQKRQAIIAITSQATMDHSELFVEKADPPSSDRPQRGQKFARVRMAASHPGCGQTRPWEDIATHLLTGDDISQTEMCAAANEVKAGRSNYQ